MVLNQVVRDLGKFWQNAKPMIIIFSYRDVVIQQIVIHFIIKSIVILIECTVIDFIFDRSRGVDKDPFLLISAEKETK